jgi:hypothetical protein
MDDQVLLQTCSQPTAPAEAIWPLATISPPLLKPPLPSATLDAIFKLELSEDINSMQDRGSWTAEEILNERRLVEFDRSQTGTTITASFRATSPDHLSKFCMSCIYWEEEDKCVFTSTDLINLLEVLIGQKISAKEKDRVRRNMESSKPKNVSKKSRLFSVIMDFPDPKPRMIKKDIKVFDWEDLSSSLHRVVGKYVSNTLSNAASYLW